MSLSKLPYEIINLIVQELEVDDVFHLSLSTQFSYFAKEERICKAILDSHVNENTPLIPNGGGSLHNGRGFWGQVFLVKDTPGLDSPNPFVSWPVHVSNVLKITLLSSKCLTPPLNPGLDEAAASACLPAMTIFLLSLGYVNVLLFSVPLGIIADVSEWSPTLVFTLNFFAIVPLAAILSFATEEISSKLGETLGGLHNATFGNAVELIVRTISWKCSLAYVN
jgi:Ca2+:H+ antiporter